MKSDFRAQKLNKHYAAGCVKRHSQNLSVGLNADEIRGTAWRDLNVGLMAASEESYEEMERFLVPYWLDERARDEGLRSIHRLDGTPRDRFDFVLCADGLPIPANGYQFHPMDTGSTVKAIIADHHALELAIGRNFPLFRHAAADRIIHRISRENGLFSLVTALPNVIPSVIDLPWAVGEFATDTAFLTMNQIRMALLMAALHGQEQFGYGEQKRRLRPLPPVLSAGGRWPGNWWARFRWAAASSPRLPWRLPERTWSGWVSRR